MREILEGLRQLLAMQHADVFPFSDTTLAHTVLEALRAIPSGIVDATAGRVGDPVLVQERQAALLDVAAREAEAGVVRFLTPVVDLLCLPPPTGEADPCRPVLLNSERLPWLVPPAAVHRRDLRLKPDLFQSWMPFVEFRGEGTGVLGGHALQQAGCVGELFEAKRLGLTEAAFGELCGYHQCIKGPCHGMLFDAASFQLFKSSNGYPVSLVKSSWTSPGSAALLRGFFSAVNEPPLLSLLRALLAALDVRPCHIAGRCYLGSGAFGHVFTVGTPDRPQALKVVPVSSHTNVAREFELLQQAAERGAPVVSPVAGSLRDLPSGGGYLLESVGQPVRLRSLRDCVALFASLAALHRVAIIHGDPRLPNVLDVGGALRWIDLREGWLAVHASVEQRARLDAGILAHSILQLGNDSALSPAVADTLAGYVVADADKVAASVNALANAVWQAHTAAAAAPGAGVVVE
jgi:hypothetical protein